MICANCKNEIGSNAVCNFCGYDPARDSENAKAKTTVIKMRPTEIVLKKSGNGMATTSLILGILGINPLFGFMSIIFGLIGLKNSKRKRCGKVRSIIGIVLSVLFLIIWFIFLIFIMQQDFSEFFNFG